MLVEINIDALVGPTHHFGGLGVGNVASQEHQFRPSNPRQAALEGLEKSMLVADLGIPQYILPPLARPDWRLLNNLGFSGSPREQLVAAGKSAPQALSAIFSGAFMWAANSATVSPAVDCADGRYHVTPANLISSWHRAGEAGGRKRDLEYLFANSTVHHVHQPLAPIVPLRDEGAANHMRLSDETLQIGFNVFVYGEREGSRRPTRFLARQTLAASQAIARRHRLDPATTFFLQQHPDAIDAGVFHNDVIATSHKGILVHHAEAYLDADLELMRLEKEFQLRSGRALVRRIVSEHELSLADAVRSYFFNSQILSPAGSRAGENVLVCPIQCLAVADAKRLIDSFVADPLIPIVQAKYVKLDESMSAGGGPACLRLRVIVNQSTLAQLPSSHKLDEKLARRLREVIEKYYPSKLTLDDFLNEEFVDRLDQIDDAFGEFAAT